MTDLRRLAGAVAGTGLGSALDVLAEPLDELAWGSFLGLVRNERITGLLLAAVRGGEFAVTDEQRRAAEDTHLDAMAAALLLERRLLEAFSTLRDASIPVRVLKGAAAAHIDYSDPSLRSFGDIDLLVPGDDFDRAVALLVDAGAQRPFAEMRPGFDRRFGKGALLVTSGGVEIDLHRTFVAGPFGLTVDFNALFATARHFTVGGSELLALDDTHRFLHACYHAAIGRGRPRLVPLRDVAEMALSGSVDTGHALATADAWRAQAVVARAVNEAWDSLGLADLTPLRVWASRYEPTAAESRMLSVYTGGGWSNGAQALAGLRVLPRFRDKAVYAHALLRPSGAALRSRNQSHVARWRRGARLVVRQLRPR